MNGDVEQPRFSGPESRDEGAPDAVIVDRPPLPFRYAMLSLIRCVFRTVSLAHDENNVYRGFYQWNDSRLADAYARALWWMLALVCAPGSIHYVVLPGLRRDAVLADPTILEAVAQDQRQVWWRLTAVEPSQQ